MSEAFEFLRKVSLFTGLPDTDLEQICQQVEEVRLPAGDLLFSEGSTGEHAYVIKEGQVEIYKTLNGQNVQLAVRQVGEVIGETSLLEAAPRSASGRAVSDSLLLAISHDQLARLLRASPTAALNMLHTVAARLRSTELLVRQNEKMAQLGNLTAGIAHELNNPASAVMRGAEQAQASFEQYRRAAGALYRLPLTPAQLERLEELDRQVHERAKDPLGLDALARSDRAAGLEEWLDEQDVEDGWELAEPLAELGFDPPGLERIWAEFPPGSLAVVLGWLALSYNMLRLYQEISMGAGRITAIVKALKSYVYLDQGPVQEIDLHEGLDNTLVILRHKLKSGVSVRREYDPRLPRIQAYGSELNQVWTNLIDNAIDSMEGSGTLLLRTARQDGWVVVEVEDSGPGIPPEVQPKLFSPFFTTKPLGQGTGLGLNISYNIVKKHGGDVRVFSRPGQTRFSVWLPLDLRQAQTGAALPTFRKPADEELKRILDGARAVAVVGISDQTDRPAHSVPAYLQRQGYHILPVNPRLEQVLGQPAYPDLLALPEPPDVVLVFRASEHAPEIIDQAIAAGAKVVWMQEGIVNEAAAAKAIQAGLQVVMDTCMRTTHRRLVGERG
jgi:signal transduction histidine kinase/predicted CoA-binding protein